MNGYGILPGLNNDFLAFSCLTFDLIAFRGGLPGVFPVEPAKDLLPVRKINTTINY